MHHSTKRRVVLGMTTGGLLVGGLGMGVAQADTAANGAAVDSPGLLSGNLIQIPVDAPVDVCGNSISVVGILDTATGNNCANTEANDANDATAEGAAKDSPGIGSGDLIQIPVDAPVDICGNSMSGVGVGDSARDNTCTNGSRDTAGSSDKPGSTANGGSVGSPGIGSGNTFQLPVNAPVDICGNSLSVIGIGDNAVGNTCSNGPATPPPPRCGCHPTPPPAPWTPKPRDHMTPTNGGQSAGTLAETGSGAASLMAPLGAGLFGGGGLLMRKRRTALHRAAGVGRS